MDIWFFYNQNIIANGYLSTVWSRASKGLVLEPVIPNYIWGY